MRQDDVTSAALEQWKPLIEKTAYKAAQRAAKIDSPYNVDDFRQELKMTLMRALQSFNPELGVKFITFIHSAFYHEINKIMRRADLNAKIGFTVGGDNFFAGDESEAESIWSQIEDDSERSAENIYMDGELLSHVRKNTTSEAWAVLQMTLSNDPFIVNQLTAYNIGVEMEAEEGGIRRFSLDMNIAFVGKLLKFSPAKIKKISEQIQGAIKSYGS
jgi:Sigma-70 region 2